MSLYEKIILNSGPVDVYWQNHDSVQKISYPVPVEHPRSKNISQYELSLVSQFNFLQKEYTLIIDNNILPELVGENIVRLIADESKLKEISLVQDIISQNTFNKKIIAVGGGILLNVSLYIAEYLRSDIILVPTTIIAMSDSSIGGKVRINKISNDILIKHFYKSFYEPNQIIVCPQFLDTLSNEQIKEGLAEIIKHAFYQSNGLKEFLFSEKFNPFLDKQSLLKAILWTADLKRICLEVDPEESLDGSNKILRAAHDISDNIEEQSNFTISHGKAVLVAMKEDLENTELKNQLDDLYLKLGINEIL
jgi:3-dehydroquinate synthetase